MSAADTVSIMTGRPAQQLSSVVRLFWEPMSAEIAASPARYWVPAHMRVAVTPTGVILLDLHRNRYFGIGTAEASALAALAENWTEVSTRVQPFEPMPIGLAETKAIALREAGLLSCEPAERAFDIQNVDPMVQLSGAGPNLQGSKALRIGYVVDFARACAWAKHAMRSRTLYAIACEVSREKLAVGRSVDLQRTLDLVSIFRRLRPYAFQAKDQCLFHAFALLKFLHLQGSHPTWIIAVRPRPWAAHSWLQLDQCVLDCTPEEVCGFTPILAI